MSVMCHGAAVSVCVFLCACAGQAKSSGMPLTLAAGDVAALAAAAATAAFTASISLGCEFLFKEVKI